MLRLLSTIAMGFVLLFSLSCSDNQSQKENQQSQTEVAEALPTRPLTKVPPADRNNYYSSAPEMTIDQGKKYIATIHSSKGDIVVELDAFYAPLHVNNFVFLSRQGFFDGLTFHRVVENFIIQGGDPASNSRGGPGYRLPAEIGLPHLQGVIAMARQGDQVNPEKLSSGSQFYITLNPQPGLDRDGYSVFGKVIQGFEVVQSIQQGDLIKWVDIEEK
ncbi:MAG: peptidylprolyl isomerase [bacterium]